MIRRRFILLFVSGWIGLGWPGVGRGAIATFALGSPTVTASEATFNVRLAFAGEPADTIEAIQLGVLGSDPVLTAGGTDFGRFSFDLNPATLPGWLELAPLSSVGVGLYAPADPISGPSLAPSAGPYSLGTLRIDLTGLPGGMDLLVNLAGGMPGLGTDVGGTVAGAFVPSFAADGVRGQLAFTEPDGVLITTIVPEPASLTLIGLGGLGLVLLARGRPGLGRMAVSRSPTGCGGLRAGVVNSGTRRSPR